jgi:hypothetical protein
MKDQHQLQKRRFVRIYRILRKLKLTRFIAFAILPAIFVLPFTSQKAYATESILYQPYESRSLKPQSDTLPGTSGLTEEQNKIIQGILQKYKDNSTTAPDVLDQTIVLKNGETVYSSTGNQSLIYLASMSKTLIIRQLGNVLIEQPQITNSNSTGNIVNDKIFSLNTYNVSEAINSGRWLAMPFLFKDRIDELHLQHATKIDVIRYMQNPDAFNSSDFALLKAKLMQDYQADKTTTVIKVSFDELNHMILTASLNSPLTIARDYMIAYYVAQEEAAGKKFPSDKEKYEAGFKILNQKLQLLVPSFEMTDSYTPYSLWFQNGPNAANVKEFASFFDKLVSPQNVPMLNQSKATINAIQDQTDIQNSIMRSIDNNKQSFDFDISTAIKLKYPNNNIDVYEKTGLYPSVFWVKNLADAGYTSHLQITSTYSTVISGARYTFLQSKSVKVSMPPLGSDGLPDEYNSDYTNTVIVPLEQKYFPEFRQNGIDLISKYTNF